MPIGFLNNPAPKESKKWKAGQLVTLKYKNTKLLCRVMKSPDRYTCRHCNFDDLPIMVCKPYCSRTSLNSKMPYGHYFKILHKHVDYEKT